MIDKSNTIRHREFFFFNYITELWYFVHFYFILCLEMIYSYITINFFCQGVILFVFNLKKKGSIYILIYLNVHISVISVSTLKNFRPALGANSKTNKTKQTHTVHVLEMNQQYGSTCMAASTKQPPGQLLLILFLLMYAMS
jgi:hypothetical protein